MVITKDLFAAYLKCRTKAYLQNSAGYCQQSKVEIWRSSFENNLRQQGLDNLQKQSRYKVVIDPAVTEFSAKESALYVNCSIDAGEMRSSIDAVEKIELRGAKTRWIPHRCRLYKRPGPHEKLLLAYDALCLREFTGAPINLGKIVDGTSGRATKVNLQGLLKVVQDHLSQLTELLSQDKEPPLLLNKHCVECEFRLRCREKAKETDDLSLLSKMGSKERQKLQGKGIFTVKQLSYTFRPRRRRKNPNSKPDQFSYPLKALAIRENKIHVAGAPAFTIQDNDCYLDVEGIPDSAFYYLIGLRFYLDGGYVQHSFWAGDRFEEERMWANLLDDLRAHGLSRIVHFGSYEKRFLETMNKRYCSSRQQSEYVETLIEQSVNLISAIYTQIYFPTYSNSLKDIGQYLGFRWPDGISNGYEALLARHYWESTNEQSVKESLVRYNTNDCEALQLVANCVSKICGQLSNASPTADSTFVDTNRLKGWGPFKIGPLDCVIPEFEHINRASYWDYQREHIVLRSHRLSKRISLDKPHRKAKFRANKVVKCRRAAVCPVCKSRKIYKYGLMSRNIYDLKFFSHGVKRWGLKYRYDRHICWACKRTFMPRSAPPTRSKFGNGLVMFMVFLTIDIQLSQGAATRFIKQFFGLELSWEAAGRFKRAAAEFYKVTYEKILRHVVQGPLVHVDETKVSLKGRSAYVWVLANQEEVIYCASETREGGKLEGILKRFNGVLVSDFYSVYDSFECPQQKCLIHLMRDINNDLLREPFNEELKFVGNRFASLVKPIIETVDRYGLKRRFMKKHKRSVERIYRWLTKTHFETGVGLAYKKRFVKNKEKLFTFMDYDDVPWNNNAAEHAIKAFATLRRVFGGSSSERGVQDYLILLSVCETCRYRGINFWDFLCSGYKDIDAYVQSQWNRRSKRSRVAK
jgi:predicted RecB family nuclease